MELQTVLNQYDRSWAAMIKHVITSDKFQLKYWVIDCYFLKGGHPDSIKVFRTVAIGVVYSTPFQSKAGRALSILPSTLTVIVWQSH